MKKSRLRMPAGLLASFLLALAACNGNGGSYDSSAEVYGGGVTRVTPA